MQSTDDRFIPRAPIDNAIESVDREHVPPLLDHSPIRVEISPHHHSGEFHIGSEMSVASHGGQFWVLSDEQLHQDGELHDLLVEGSGLLSARLLVHGEETVLGLQVVQQHSGDQRPVVREAQELLVRHVGRELRRPQEVRRGEVLTVADVHPEDAVVEGALHVTGERGRYAENAVVVQTADAVARQKVGEQTRHVVVVVVEEHQICQHAAHDVLLLDVHVPHRHEVIDHLLDQSVALGLRGRRETHVVVL